MRAPSLLFLLSSLLVLSAASTPTGTPAADAPSGGVCDTPASLVLDDTPLTRVRGAIDEGRAVSILAVGSGIMAEAGGDAEKPSFPIRILAALRAAAPHVTFDLVVRSAAGMRAADMVDTIDRELASGHFTLVVWQTGTVEAVHAMPLDEFNRILIAGATRVHEAGADLLLVDPPYSRVLKARADVAAYENRMVKAADLPGVAIFRRFDVMQYWADTGRLDLDHVPKSGRPAAAAALHTCLAAAIARLILHGVELAAPPRATE
jgi:hypothetical protein